MKLPVDLIQTMMDRIPHAKIQVVIIAIVAAATLLLASTSNGDASSGRTVRTTGDASFIPNSKLMFTLKFAPGNVTVKSGETLTLSHDDKTEEPHTLSIVDADEVPGDIDEVFGCGEPGTVCDDIFSAFGAEPSGPVFVNGPGTGAGIDGRLDSLFVVPGTSITETITAEPGTTLNFICAIHAWMQGTIKVQ